MVPAGQSRQIVSCVAVAGMPTLWPGMHIEIALHTRLPVGEPGIDAY